jgi:hypothetical protein
MDFSWDWVKQAPVMATEPLVRARLAFAWTAKPQATHRLMLEGPEPDSWPRPLLSAVPA